MYSVILMAALTTSVDLPDRRGGCCGCRGGGYGGCYGGYGYGGCMGMGYGYGGCMGMGYGGGYGYGGCMGMGYGGGYGYGGCMGMGGYGFGGGMIMPGTIQPSGERLQKKPTEKETKDETLAPAPAIIVVELPADAKLLIDNEATTSTGSSRVFQSPALNPGKEYHYTIKAEVVRDGKPVKAEQVVTVKAGEITPVTLTVPAAGIAQR